MKTRRPVIIVTAVVIALALVACQKQGPGQQQAAKADSGTVVARIGSEVITLEQFEEYLNSQNPLVRSRYSALDQKKRLLQSLVEREAMVQEAKRLKLDQDPQVQLGLKKILARHLVNKVFNQQQAKAIKITDEEIEQYYRQNESRYHAPEKVRVHHIFFAAPAADKKARTAARARAQQALAKLQAKPNDRRLFIELARRTTEDEKLKNTGGDTGFKTRQEMEQTYGPAFAKAAFALKKVNDISPIVEGEKGFYLLRQSGRQPAVDLPLEKVKEQIRATLLTRKKADAYRAFVEQIKNKAGVKVFEDTLAKAKVDLSNVPRRPGLPPGRPGIQPLRRIKIPKALDKNKARRPPAPPGAPRPANH